MGIGNVKEQKRHSSHQLCLTCSSKDVTMWVTSLGEARLADDADETSDGRVWTNGVRVNESSCSTP